MTIPERAERPANPGRAGQPSGDADARVNPWRDEDDDFDGRPHGRDYSANEDRRQFDDREQYWRRDPERMWPGEARRLREREWARNRRQAWRRWAGRPRPWRHCRRLAWRCEDGFERACIRWRRNCAW